MQVPVWAKAPLAAALATPVSLLMINGALSYNTHVLDKAGHDRRLLGCADHVQIVEAAPM